MGGRRFTVTKNRGVLTPSKQKCTAGHVDPPRAKARARRARAAGRRALARPLVLSRRASRVFRPPRSRSLSPARARRRLRATAAAAAARRAGPRAPPCSRSGATFSGATKGRDAAQARRHERRAQVRRPGASFVARRARGAPSGASCRSPRPPWRAAAAGGRRLVLLARQCAGVAHVGAEHHRAAADEPPATRHVLQPSYHETQRGQSASSQSAGRRARGRRASRSRSRSRSSSRTGRPSRARRR